LVWLEAESRLTLKSVTAVTALTGGEDNPFLVLGTCLGLDGHGSCTPPVAQLK